MRVFARWTLIAALPLLILGCGDGPDAQFATSERVNDLIRGARDGIALENEQGERVEVDGIEAKLDDLFGTPENLVAWRKLPVEFGEIEGKVVEPASRGLAHRLKVELTGNAGDEAEISEDDIRGTGLLWTSGTYANLDVEIKQGDREVGFQVRDYDAATGELALNVSLDPNNPPQSGDTFVLVGHKLKHGKQVYMRHCMHCHGVTGNGDGPTAQYLNPRPRDYRQGIFKFKSTLRPDKPRLADLKRTVQHGIPGTYMPSFMLLPEKDLNAVVEYVRWLSMRGELEQAMAVLMDSRGFTQQSVEQRVESAENPQETRQQVNEDLADYLQNDFADEATTEAEIIAENWQRVTEDSSLVKPETARSTTVGDLASWLIENEAAIAAGRVEGVTQSGEGDDGDAQALVLSVRLNGKPAEPPQQIRWLSGATQGRTQSIVRFDAEKNEIAVSAGDDAPAAGDRFVLAGEFPGGLDYVLQNGASLEELLQMAEHDAQAASSAEGGQLRDWLLQASLRRGRGLFIEKNRCTECHGPLGRGNGTATEDFAKKPNSQETYDEPGLHNDWGEPIEPRDLTRGVYRGGRRPVDLYRRIYAGIPGTPMPANNTDLDDVQIWDLVNYVLSIPRQEEPPQPMGASAEGERVAASRESKIEDRR